MSSRIGTNLLIRATSGIGEALTHRFHGMGKKVIVTGRDRTKLATLAAELNGLETRHLDLADLASLPAIVTQILKDFPTLDTVFINGGIQKYYDLFNPATTSADQIIHEITVNLTAPNLLARLFAPHLLALAESGSKSNIFITSSSIAYIPLGFYPTYCAAKAGVHAFTKCFRQQLSFAGEEACKNMNIVEVVPPYVDTGLDHEHREFTVAIQGGEDKASPPITLDDYIDRFFATLEKPEPDGSFKKEIGVGLVSGETPNISIDINMPERKAGLGAEMP
ncbi:NAD(P)-binding protein [Xylaria castorea]|nr:NAD(P)-binding protein [Xylaria castorea]